MAYDYYPQYPQGGAVANYSLNPTAYQQQRYPQQPFTQQQVYPPQMQQPIARQTNIDYVNGVAGAKAMPVPPNATRLALDSEGAYFYIKSTDMEGKPVLKRFHYEEVDDNGTPVMQHSPHQTQSVEYATVQEVQQAISRLEQSFRSELDKIKQPKQTSNSENKK